MRHLGLALEFSITDAGRNKERMVFIYDHNKVLSRNIVGEDFSQSALRCSAWAVVKTKRMEMITTLEPQPLIGIARVPFVGYLL